MQDERKNGPSKQPALFRLAWVWLGVFGVATLICYFVGWRELSHVLLAVTIVMGTIAEISSRYILVPRLKSRSISNAEPEEDTEAEEFYIHFPDPAESGWHNYTVTPSKNIYKEEFCVGGPPTDISTFEYSVEANQVFARLVDLHEEGLNGVQYEVVSGQVLEAQIRSRKTYDTTDEHIERLKKDVQWNEIPGALRYFILSKHGCQAAFFSRERQRLDRGFSSLAEKAALLGGVRDRGYYKPMNSADENSKAAIRDLQQTVRLEHFGISFNELIHYEHIIQTLEGLISGSEGAVRP